MKDLKWALIIGGIIFIAYAIYNSPKSTDNKLISADNNQYVIDSSNYKVNSDKGIYVLNGDTLDVSKDKFIMILADKYSDKSISLSLNMWYSNNMNICAMSPGVLKVFIYNKNMTLLKT